MTDEYEGMGGSYIADKKTGKRKLVERTCEASDVSRETIPPADNPPAVTPLEQKDEI